MNKIQKSNKLIIHIIILSAFLLSMTGCAGFKVVRIPIPIPTFGIGNNKTAKSQPTKTTHTQTVSSNAEVGQASWYGRQFHGKRTASGDKYSMYEMTAAHPTLPFDTNVKVTNLENGKSVYLRINDRGPFTKGRIIDVSRAAARKLDFERKGIAQVKVETN